MNQDVSGVGSHDKWTGNRLDHFFYEDLIMDVS